MAFSKDFGQKGNNPFYFTKFEENGFEFDPTATEVAILDDSGQAVWSKSKGEEMSPIRWNGHDEKGERIDTGDYICKIVYPNEKVAYLPFVFMKRG
jgi:flagellar hook assembly protein FlgD